jgi:hypothetical protein
LVAGLGGGNERADSHPESVWGAFGCDDTQAGTGFLTWAFSTKIAGFTRRLGPRLSDHVIAVAS